jgi:hypothetical protein
MMPPTHNTRVNSFHLYGLYKLILSKKVVEKHYDPYKSNKKKSTPIDHDGTGGDSQKQYCKLCEHGERDNQSSSLHILKNFLPYSFHVLEVYQMC